MEVRLTKLPQFNSVVIRQKGGHFFISTPDSIIIDKDGFLRLIIELYRIGFINTEDISKLIERLGESNANTENSGNTHIGESR